MEHSKNRKANYAGSWYSSDSSELNKDLTGYLDSAEVTVKEGFLKGIIAPHAGYEFSGPTAGWSYKNIDPTKYSRVILLGPSHHFSLDNCAITMCSTYETPLGNISIDSHTIEELNKKEKFDLMSIDVDQKEHSLEMHLPFIKKIFGDKEIKLVPIMVGEFKKERVENYGRVFAQYMQDQETLFIISSDFCHWGKNFEYVYYNRIDGAIHESIAKLDKIGMDTIASHKSEDFQAYLEATDNTICGKNPILVYMQAIKESGLHMETKFVKYAQSDKVVDKEGSSVSYAAAYTVVK